MRRQHDARSMLAALDTMDKIRQKMDPDGEAIARNMPGMDHLFPKPPTEVQVQPEQRTGHCLKCKASKTFLVEGEEKMPQGQIRKWGKCTEPGCSTQISTFVSGKEGKSAA